MIGVAKAWLPRVDKLAEQQIGVGLDGADAFRSHHAEGIQRAGNEGHNPAQRA